MTSSYPSDPASSPLSDRPAFVAIANPPNWVVGIAQQLRQDTPDLQLQKIQDLATKSELGLGVLMEFLYERRFGQSPKPLNFVDGAIYHLLVKADNPDGQKFLAGYFPQGLVPLASNQNLDYSELQQLLVDRDYQAADLLTLQKLCELAGPTAVKRRWVYFTEVSNFPIVDLQTIDTLWRVYSNGKFGFSVQREIWLSVGKNWNKLWPRIGWQREGDWTRYPGEFIWDLSAPNGHLPLSNQLRGVQTFAALLSHPAWA